MRSNILPTDIEMMEMGVFIDELNRISGGIFTILFGT